MKHKKIVTAIIVGLLALITPLNGYAKEVLNVWVETADWEMKSNELAVEVKTDGTSTDGLLVITYDGTVLRVKETDVVWSNSVEMSSVNVVEEGTLKIAYLAEDPIEEGTLATINFETINDAASAESLSLSGDVHDADGNTLCVGIAEAEDIPESNQPTDDTPETEDTPAADLPNHDNTTDDAEKPSNSSKDAADTGDETKTLLYLVCGLIGIAISGTVLLKMRKRRG